MAVNAMSDITAVENVPKGAVLNRFCDQLAPHGTTGDGDWVPLIEGHGRYLSDIQAKTEQLPRTRKIG